MRFEPVVFNGLSDFYQTIERYFFSHSAINVGFKDWLLKDAERKLTLVEKVVIILVLLIVACLALPHATKAVENAIWSEARQTASQIRQNALIFCQEKGQGWKHYKNANIYDLGYSYSDLDGTYFKHDSYSVKFFGYRDFFIKITVTETTRGRRYFDKYLLTLDENGQWGYINSPD